MVKHYMFSQIASITAQSSTNFFEVLKVRKIMDSHLCAPEHYRTKPKSFLLDSLIKSMLRPKESLNKVPPCSNCLPNQSVFGLFRDLARQEGYSKVFLGGLKPALVSNILRVGIFFPVREALVKIFKSDSSFDFLRRNEAFSSVLSSGIARTISSVCSFPLDIMKIDKQLNIKSSSSNDFFRISKWGKFVSPFLQFYQKEMVNSLLFWIVYEQFRTFFKKNERSSEVWINVQSAAFAGAFSALLSHPNDYFQTVTNSMRNQNEKVGSWKLFHILWKEKKVSNILAGSLMRTSRGFFINFIFFGIFENLKRKTKKHH